MEHLHLWSEYQAVLLKRDVLIGKNVYLVFEIHKMGL